MPVSILSARTTQNREAFDWETEERQRTLGTRFLENLLLGLHRFKSDTLCLNASEKIASRPDTFSPVTLVVPAIEQICVGTPTNESGGS